MVEKIVVLMEEVVADEKGSKYVKFVSLLQLATHCQSLLNVVAEDVLMTGEDVLIVCFILGFLCIYSRKEKLVTPTAKSHDSMDVI